MNDFLETIVPIWKTAAWRAKWKFAHALVFGNSLENHKPMHRITKRYQEKIGNALNWTEEIQETINHIIETLKRLINKYDLTDETNKNLIFDQLIIFINNLYLKLRSKYIFNTLSKNNLKKFNELTIWGKINNLMQKEGSDWYTWCCCKHYALLFKDIFDKIEESLNLWISSYLFLEKIDWLNHAWVVVTFNWKNYLADSSFFNWKFMQPIENIWKYYNRMKDLSDFYMEDIPSSEIETIKNDYIEHKNDYYKVAFKSRNELLSLLDLLSPQAWSFSKMYNIFGNVLWVNFRIFNDKLIFFNTFCYYFDHKFSEEELDNLTDEELMSLIINSISYKSKIGNNKKIAIFDFEKKYIQDSLSYFLDKIDFVVLRKILSNAHT